MYRKIVVAEKEYQYVIGKTNTHIKGVGTFVNSQIGKPRYSGGYCECCGSRMDELYPNDNHNRLQVTPADIRNVILRSGI